MTVNTKALLDQHIDVKFLFDQMRGVMIDVDSIEPPPQDAAAYSTVYCVCAKGAVDELLPRRTYVLAYVLFQPETDPATRRDAAHALVDICRMHLNNF